MLDSIKRRPLAAVSFIVAVLLVLGVLSFAGPCVHEDGSAAACHAARIAIAVDGVVGAIVSLVALFARSSKVVGCAAIFAAAAGLAAAASPGTLFGLCMMQTMRCWTVMRPFALVCGVALVICALITAIMAFRRREGSAS